LDIAKAISLSVKEEVPWCKSGGKPDNDKPGVSFSWWHKMIMDDYKLFLAVIGATMILTYCMVISDHPIEAASKTTKNPKAVLC
jgi:hypothetical protein